jgi:hypothetical protein
MIRAPFDAEVSLGREIVLDGEINVHDRKGATYIGDMQEELASGTGERLAYFGRDLRTLARS